jgi:hypothetical protein
VKPAQHAPSQAADARSDGRCRSATDDVGGTGSRSIRPRRSSSLARHRCSQARREVAGADLRCPDPSRAPAGRRDLLWLATAARTRCRRRFRCRSAPPTTVGASVPTHRGTLVEPLGPTKSQSGGACPGLDPRHRAQMSGRRAR